MPDAVRFVLDGRATSAASVADLAFRESQCCSFLGFDLSMRNDSLELVVVSSDVEHADAVAALAERAEILRSGHARR